MRMVFRDEEDVDWEMSFFGIRERVGNAFAVSSSMAHKRKRGLTKGTKRGRIDN